MAVGGAQLVVDLAIVTTAAAAATLLFHRYRQPVVVGYLLAGFLVGPHGPLYRFVGVASLDELAQLGIVFLMFSLGLEFRLRRLTRSGIAAGGAALLGMAAMALSGYAVTRLAGWSPGDALFMGAILAISSTVIAAKALQERGQLSHRWAELSLGVLIVQDIAAVAILAVLGAKHGQGFGVLDLLEVLGRLATFAMAALVLGLLFVPRLINQLARRGADEVLVLSLSGLALGTAALGLFLGFSPALGAFLIGAVVAEASEAWRAEHRVVPLRDLFTAVFFVSIGMLLDPAVLLDQWPIVAGLAALMIAVKVVFHTLPAFFLGAAPRDAFRASLSLAQIGEFSFVIAALGLSLREAGPAVLPVTVAIATASALWTPYLLRGADPAYAAFARWIPVGVRAAANRYRSWAHAHTAARAARIAPEVRRVLVKGLLNGAAVGLILLATQGTSAAVLQWVTVRGLTDRSLALFPWMLGGVIALPFALNAARAAWDLLGPRGLAVHPAPGRDHTRLRSALLVVSGALGLFMVFLVAVPFLPPTPLLLLSLAAFLGAALVLYGSMVRVHGRVAETLEQALGGEMQGEDRVAVLDALRREVRWGLDVERVRVEPGTAAAGATVRSLDLRARTGATLLAVQRTGHATVNPSPSFVVYPGDALLLLGDNAQLEQARQAVREPAPGAAGVEEPFVAQVRVAEGSALADRTLLESALREKTGATIVGMLRGGHPVPSPGAQTRVLADDVLLIVGSPEHLAAAKALAEDATAEADGGNHPGLLGDGDLRDDANERHDRKDREDSTVDSDERNGSDERPVQES